MSAAGLAELGLSLPSAAASSTVADVDMLSEEAAVKAEEAAPKDLYTQLKESQRELDFLRIQEAYIKDESRRLPVDLSPPLALVRVFLPDGSYEPFDAGTRLGVIKLRLQHHAMTERHAMTGVVCKPPSEAVNYLMDHSPIPAGDYYAVTPFFPGQAERGAAQHTASRIA